MAITTQNNQISTQHKSHYVKGLFKFLLLLGVLVCYFFYLSWKYDFATGGIVSALTWSFFVLCTPVADAGFLIDFPVRILTGIRMFVIELFVWVMAIAINAAALSMAPDAYDKTVLTHVFYKILIHPWPYWSIIGLCAAGTFVSIYLGDEIFDAVSRRKKQTRLALKYKVPLTIGFLCWYWRYILIC